MPSTSSKAGLSAAGGIAAAIGSALCCAGPLVALLLGVSGAGLARTFEPLRPVLGGALMFSSLKLLAVATIGAAILCPLCESRVASGASAVGGVMANAIANAIADTATARLHISGITCGSCPTTAATARTRRS